MGIITVVWSIFMLYKICKATVYAFDPLEKIKKEAKQSLESLIDHGGIDFARRTTVTISFILMIISVLFWTMMASMFNTLLLKLYCCLIVVVAIMNFIKLFDFVKEFDIDKMTPPNIFIKIMAPINICVVTYFIYYYITVFLL